MAGQHTLKINCESIPECNDVAFEGGLGIVLRVEQGILIETTFLNSFTRFNYDTVMAVTFSLGLILLVLVTFDTVSKIITFGKVMKAVKVR